MKVSVLQEDFSKAVNTATRFVHSRAQLPILGNIRLVAKKNTILIQATNLESSISIPIGSKNEEDGEITVPARTFSELLNTLKSGTVDIETKKEKINIKASSFESEITGMNAADFPQVPEKIEKESLTLQSNLFKNIVNKCLFAASVDETRPVLTGILFVFGKKDLKVVSTDGFRLSLMTQSMDTNLEDSVIIPRTILGEIPRISEVTDVSLSFESDNNQVLFGLDDIVVSSRIIDGKFPDYERIIPKESDMTCIVKKEDLDRAVRISGVFARDSANHVVLKVIDNTISFMSTSSSFGKQSNSVHTEIKGKAPKEAFEISFNYKYLLDILNVLEGDIELSFSDTNSAGVIKQVGDKSFLHLIMPVKM